MRVLMVSSLWPPAVIGGAETYAARLTAELRLRGHEVGVVTGGVSGEGVVAQVRGWPYRLDTWDAQPRWKRAAFHAADLYRPGTAGTLRAAMARFSPDVIHTHAVQGMSTAALTAPSGADCAHVHSVHDYWLLCQRTTLRTRSGRRCRRCSTCGAIAVLRRTLLSRSGPDLYLAPSKAVARRHAHLGDRVRVVLHPVEPPTIRTEPAAVENDAITFGYLGQLTDVKGVHTLLEAFSAFAEQRRHAGVLGESRLLVAGTGPLGSVVRRRADSGVEALGWLDAHAKERFFSAIDCLIVPSVWEEPAGLVIGEAASRGVPVIGAAIGGIPDYVPPACRELLFAPGDAGSLSATMDRFSVSAPNTAWTDVAHLPTWDRHIEAVLNAYQDARRQHADAGCR
jgi:glycosyltransferase involved in cell wall biosynthesis